MTSYGGITRIRLKGRSWMTSSQPAHELPCFVGMIIYLHGRHFKNCFEISFSAVKLIPNCTQTWDMLKCESRISLESVVHSAYWPDDIFYFEGDCCLKKSNTLESVG